MYTLLPFFVAFVATFAKSIEEELCVVGDCSNELKSHSLLQRKHTSAAPAKAHEELPATKSSSDAPACEGVDADGRCWYLSEKGENCEAACLKHGRSFKFKMPKAEKPIVSMLLKKEPVSQEGPWRAFECYKPEEDHLHLVSHCSANDYRDNQGSWSDPDCQLACPCGGVKECTWKQPAACVPVFQYKDNQLTGCPKLDSERPWCSHDHDKTDEWSYCAYSCTDASANGATEMFTEPPFPEGAEEIEMVSMENPDAVVLKSGNSVAYAASGLMADPDPEQIDSAHEIKETKAAATPKEENIDASKTEARLQGTDMKEQPISIKEATKSISATAETVGLDSDDDKNPPVEKENGNAIKEDAKKDINQHLNDPKKVEDSIKTATMKQKDALKDAEETASQSKVSESSGAVQKGDLSSDPEKGGKEEKSEKKEDEKDEKDDKTEKSTKDTKKDKDDDEEKEKGDDESDSKEEKSKDNASEKKAESSSEKNGAIQLSSRLLPLLTLPSIVACVLTPM